MKVIQESTELIIKERYLGNPISIVYIIAVIIGATSEIEFLPLLLANLEYAIAIVCAVFFILLNFKKVTVLNLFSRVVTVKHVMLFTLSQKIINIFSFDYLYITQTELGETGELRPLAKKSELILVYNGTEVMTLGTGKINMLGHGKFLDSVRLVSLYLGIEALPLDSGHTIKTRDHFERDTYGYGKVTSDKNKDFGDELDEYFDEEFEADNLYEEDNKNKKLHGEYTIEDFKREYSDKF